MQNYNFKQYFPLNLVTILLKKLNFTIKFKVMKKILILLFISVIGLQVNAQEVHPDSVVPIFKFDQETIDYGDIAHNSDGNRTFRFKNVGKSPLIISQVKGSCGCTVPTKPKEPIMPGEYGEIMVKYATNRVGPFSKTVTITSNASEKTKVVRIKGRVLEPKKDNSVTQS